MLDGLRCGLDHTGLQIRLGAQVKQRVGAFDLLTLR